jgi:hypothetical protein
VFSLCVAGSDPGGDCRFLRNGLSLGEVAARCGITKSSLWRHSQHGVKAEAAATQPTATRKAKTPLPAPPKPARPAKTAVPAPQETALTAPAPKTPAPPVTEPPLDVEGKRQRAEGRLERLWDEALDGLEAAKQPITIDKGNGEVITVPPDLRARAGFIKCGQSIIDSPGKTTRPVRPTGIDRSAVWRRDLRKPNSDAQVRRG